MRHGSILPDYPLNLPVIESIHGAGVDTLQGLTEALNARGIQTARGGQWYPTTERNVIKRRPACSITAQAAE